MGVRGWLSRRRAPGNEQVGGASLGRQLARASALGVIAAVVIAVCSNVLVARFYKRWDVTSAGLYTLSQATLETLRGLSDPMDILVFLGAADPNRGGVQRLLSRYEAESPLIRVRYVDPDRQPAEFLALQNQYRLTQGRAERGQLVSDAALVVARGDARWVIGAEDIVLYDDERGTVQPRLEQAVTEGLRQVLDPDPYDVCVSQGLGEPSLDDGGPTGLGALRSTLERNNYVVRELDLSTAGGELGLDACELVIVAGPEQTLGATPAGRLEAAARRGTNVLTAIGPTLGEDNRALPSGFEPLLAVFGVRPRQQLIFERDAELALPLGMGGEIFLALPRPHPITQGLREGAEPRFRVLLQLAQGFEGDSPAVGLLATSPRAFSVGSAATLVRAGASVSDLTADAEGPFQVAMAAELAPVKKQERGARLVALGSPSPLLGNTWLDPSLTGTRRFVESSLAWLTSRPTLVSLPGKPEQPVAMRFTEESLGQVLRYVLVYMPGTALLLGLLVLYRRRWSGRSEAGARGGEA